MKWPLENKADQDVNSIRPKGEIQEKRAGSLKKKSDGDSRADVQR